MALTELDRRDAPAVARRPGAERWLGEVGRTITFGDARLPEEHPEILSLRLRAHQRHGQLAGLAPLDLASPFDAHSRHLVCRRDGRILGYVRLIEVGRDSARSQYVAWGGHEVPGWLWRAGFVEAGAGAMEPGCRMPGLFHALVQHAVGVARRSGHRYILGASEECLLAMYRDMGFSWLESRDVEPRPGWRFRSHLFVMDLDGLLRAPPEGRWVAMMTAAVAAVDAGVEPPPAASARARP